MKPRLLDLFCGAGGAAMGYHRAGFDVVGVDIKPQPRFPFLFVRADALAAPFDLRTFDAIHASPPCQHYMQSGMIHKGDYPDLLPATRRMLMASGTAWVIENVPGAPMTPTFTLCGSMFGLGIKRHRHFEIWPPVLALHPQPCDHSRPITGVYGHSHGKGGAWRKGKRPMLASSTENWRREMGIDWMKNHEITQAIPPAYTEFIGRQLIAHTLGMERTA